MPWPPERQRPRCRFGVVYEAHMTRVGITAKGISHRLELAGHLLHPTAVSHYLSEDRTVAPKLVNLFAKVLELDDEQAIELHQAAALDYGYEIGEE